MNKRKVLDYLNDRIKELEAQDVYYNKHDENHIITGAIKGLNNIKNIIEMRLEEERSML
jgi:hypothetical protein